MKRLIVWLMIFLCCGVAWAATTTTNYGLYKPAVGDTDWGDLINGNFDTIDTQMKTTADAEALNTSHRTDNTQAHSDYLLNNQSDSTTGTITAGGFIGDLTGNADTATYSQAVNWTAVEALSPINSASINWDSLLISDTQVVFLDGTDPSGDAGLTYNKSTNILTSSGGFSSGGSPSIVAGAVTWNAGDYIDGDAVNWDTFDGLIKSSNINWANIEVIAPINGASINWTDLETLSRINGAAINWTDLEVLARINNAAINWADMTDLASGGAVSWGNLAEGELADSTIVSADIKDGVIMSADVNWTNIEVIGPINNLSVNWADMTDLTTGGEVVWSNAIEADLSGVNWADYAKLADVGVNWLDTIDLTTGGEVVWANLAEGELADSTVVSGDIKDGTITAADTAITAGRSLTWSTNDLVADAELYTDTKCVYILAPVATDDLKSIWYAKGATTITSIWCESDQTVTAMLQVDDGTPADVDGTDLTCDSTPPEDTSLDGDATLAAGDRLDLDIASVSGTPTWVSICWTATKDD